MLRIAEAFRPLPAKSGARFKRKHFFRLELSFHPVTMALKSSQPLVFVMAGLVPAIHVLAATRKTDVDARDKPGHDEEKRHEQRGQQQVSRGPRPVAQGSGGVLGGGGERDRLDRTAEENIRSQDGSLRPLVSGCRGQ